MSDQNINISLDENNTTPKSINNIDITNDLTVITPKFKCSFCNSLHESDQIKTAKCKHFICKSCFLNQDDRYNIVCIECKNKTEKILSNIEQPNCCQLLIKTTKNNYKLVMFSCCSILFFLILIISISYGLTIEDDDNYNKTNNTVNNTNTTQFYNLLKF